MGEWIVTDNKGGHCYEGDFDMRLATDPDWNCPNCQWVNYGMRVRCRNCRKHVNELFPGEGLLVGAFTIDGNGIAKMESPNGE